MNGDKNQRVNELLEMDDVLTQAMKTQVEKDLTPKEIERQRKQWRREYFAELPMHYVGTDDLRLDQLRQKQKDEGLTVMQTEELLYRQEIQSQVKKAKRDKAKKKRQNRRYNRARQR